MKYVISSGQNLFQVQYFIELGVLNLFIKYQTIFDRNFEIIENY